MNSISIIKYTSDLKGEWDLIINNAKNSPFFAKRDFMEYHAERYQDFSLMVESKGKFIAAIPANINKKGDTIISHAGLTFGGIYINKSTKTLEYLNIFREIIIYLHKNKISKFIYKVPPIFYHQTPSEEDIYAIYLSDGKLIRRDLGTVLDIKSIGDYTKLRKRMLRKGKDSGIEIVETDDFSLYWPLLEDVLKRRHEATAIHTLEEIKYLKNKCKENIHLFLALKSNDILAGVVIFESKIVVHAQYIASNDYGRETGALDLIFDHLIKDKFKEKKWLSFGISTEDMGRSLNEGLIRYKESFGGSSCVFDFYEINVDESFKKINI